MVEEREAERLALGVRAQIRLKSKRVHGRQESLSKAWAEMSGGIASARLYIL